MTNYILEYYQGIKDGSIVVGRWIERWYDIIIEGLRNKSFYFDPKKANRAIKFKENFAHHHEGDLAPQLLKLELWQKAFYSVIYGIVNKDGYRQFNEVLLVVARKTGKTLLAASDAEQMLFADGEYGARIYFVAPKLDQARICYDAFYQMILQEPELKEMSKKRRTDVYVASTNSSAQPIAFNAKKSDGLNPHFICADEIAAWSGEAGLKQYEVLTSALGARKQPMLLSITTANYEDGIYDELIKRATAIFKGTSNERHFAPFIYQIDDVTKWNDINELQKSMPNLNVSTSVDWVLNQIAIAEQSLSKKREFLTKMCNIKQNSSVAWLDATVIEKSYGEPLNLEDFRDCYAVMGIDLSRTTDLTCATLLIQKNGKIYTFARFYLPKDKLEEAKARDNLPYDIYVQRKELFLSGDNFVNYKDAYEWCRELIEKYHIYVLQVGYDRYSSTYLIDSLKQYGFHCDDVYQGENLTPVINETEGLIKDGVIKIGDNDLLKIHFYNSALKLNTETERCRLIKVEQRKHIDGMAAFLCGMCVRMKRWNEIGTQLANERS